MLLCKHVRLSCVINADLLTYLLIYLNKLFSRPSISQLSFIILAVYRKHPGNFSCPPRSPGAPQPSTPRPPKSPMASSLAVHVKGGAVWAVDGGVCPQRPRFWKTSRGRKHSTRYSPTTTDETRRCRGSTLVALPASSATIQVSALR